MTEAQIKQLVSEQYLTEKRKAQKKKIIYLVSATLFVPLTIWAAALVKPHTFNDGDTLSASKLNENFDTLYAKTNELDSLLPVGTILGWHKSMPNTPQSLPPGWVECNGQTLSDGGSVYNGQVIPNLNGAAAGANSPGQLTKEAMFLRGGQVSGTGQVDAFQGHWHDLSLVLNGTTGGGTGDNTGTTGTIRSGAVQNAAADGVNGTPRTANETRPKNMSVVWLIRVK